jgi:hypothetical protein
VLYIPCHQALCPVSLPFRSREKNGGRTDHYSQDRQQSKVEFSTEGSLSCPINNIDCLFGGIFMAALKIINAVLVARHCILGNRVMVRARGEGMFRHCEG